MPVDTSIALGVRPPQFQTIDPMTIYNAVQDQRMNALREQVLQQTMAQNALTMQNTMEDRRAAAAKAARDLREQQELIRIVQSGRIPARDVVMGPGTIQASTPAGYDFEGVKNKMLERGRLSGYEALSKAQEQEANRLKAQLAARNEGFTGTKIQTETEGLNLKNIDTQLTQLSSSIDRAPTMEAVYAIYSAAPDALAVRGQTPETAIKAFNDRVTQLTQGGLRPDQAFTQAKMEAANGAMVVQKQLSDQYKTLETPQGILEYTPGTGEARRIMVQGAPNEAGQPAMPVDRRSVTNIDMKGQGKFAEELGTLQAKKLVEGQASAEKASSLIDTVNQGRKLLDKGILSGFGADYKLAFAKAAKELGVAGFDGKIENTETYVSNMAKNTALLIDQFGAGSAISNADREYATKMAAGEISLDEQSLRKILGIAEEVARKTIEKHNARAKGVKSELPLTVDMPPTASGLPYFTHPSQVKAANLPSGTRFMTPDGEKVVP